MDLNLQYRHQLHNHFFLYHLLNLIFLLFGSVPCLKTFKYSFNGFISPMLPIVPGIKPLKSPNACPVALKIIGKEPVDTLYLQKYIYRVYFHLN